MRGTVGEPAGEPAQPHREPLGDAFDDPEERDGRSERDRQEERHDRVRELAREVVRERHPAQRANVLRKGAAGGADAIASQRYSASISPAKCFSQTRRFSFSVGVISPSSALKSRLRIVKRLICS